MPLNYTKAKYSGSLDLVHRRAQRLAASNRHPEVAGRLFETQRMDPPHAVYTLRAEDFAAGKTLGRSVFCNGYRFLIKSAGQPYMAAEVHPHHLGQNSVSFNVGPYVGGTVRALRHLAVDDRVKYDNYEVRFLRCFPLCFMALWLKSDNAGDDLIYPLEGGAPPPFQAEKLYRLADFQGNIQAILQARQAKG